MTLHSPQQQLQNEQVDVCIRLARDGCAKSLGELYERCHRYLLHIANHELHDQMRAKLGPSDIVQETLLKAQGNFGRFDGRTEAELKAWLRAILLNSIRDTNRLFQAGGKRDIGRERQLHQLLARDTIGQRAGGVETPSRQAMLSEETRVLQAALQKLPEDYRQVVTLRNIDRKAFSEIGQIMGRSSEATRKLWVRSVERLRQLLGGEDAAPG